MFVNFRALFLEVIFEVTTLFLSPSTYPIDSTFTMLVRMYKIHVSNKKYFLLGTIAMCLKERLFSVSMATIDKETNSSSLSIQTMLEKNGTKQIKNTPKNIYEKVYLLPHWEGPTILGKIFEANSSFHVK